MSRWRLLAAAAPLTAYALISRALMARWPTSPWAVAALFGPLLLPLLLVGLARRHLPSLAGAPTEATA